jgi:diphthamide biosynthesis protein 3
MAAVTSVEPHIQAEVDTTDSVSQSTKDDKNSIVDALADAVSAELKLRSVEQDNNNNNNNDNDGATNTTNTASIADTSRGSVGSASESDMIKTTSSTTTTVIDGIRPESDKPTESRTGVVLNPDFVDDGLGSIYDEIEIEDMEFDDETETYYYPCPCGDRFFITLDDLCSGEDIGECPSCSLRIRIIYDPEDFMVESDDDSSSDDDDDDE